MQIKNLMVFMKNPLARFEILSSRGLLNYMSDERYIRKCYELSMGKEPNLENPITYNEKLQWLKLNDRREIYTTMVDKYEVKEYVAGIIGEEYIIPTLGVWDRFEDIDFDTLPNQFVLKCTHDSGGIVIVTDKAELDIEKARKTINKSLGRNYYYSGREWPYKNVKPRIIAEKYMEGTAGTPPEDYKFFCFNGKCKAMFIATDRFSSEETKFDFFDMNYEHLPFTNGHPNASTLPPKPVTFEQMRILAEKLSNGFPHVRVDFYEIDGKVYFGELTLSHWSGFKPFEPEEWDEIFGSWLELPKLKQ